MFGNLEYLDVEGELKEEWVEDEYGGWLDLVCTGQLTSLDLGRNTKLRELRCGYNQLETLVLPENSPLSAVYADRNYPLTDVTIGNCPSLSHINLNQANVRSLDVSGCPNLGLLSCSGSFKTIDMSHNPELWYLMLSGDNLETVELLQNPKLRELRLSSYDSSITWLDLANCIDLRLIGISGYSGRTIGLSNNRKLERICLAGSNLREVYVWEGFDEYLLKDAEYSYIPSEARYVVSGVDENIQTLWTGPALVDWDNPIILSSENGFDWSTCKVGSVVKIYGKSFDETAEWYGLHVRGVSDQTDVPGLPGQYDRPGNIGFMITDEVLNNILSKEGLLIAGVNYEVNKVEIIPPSLVNRTFINIMGFHGQGSFESGYLPSNFICWGDYSPTMQISPKGEGYSSDYSLKFFNPMSAGQYNGWMVQCCYDNISHLDPSQTYVMSFFVKADNSVAELGFRIQNTGYSHQIIGFNIDLSSEWLYVEYEFTTEGYSDIHSLIFDFGAHEGSYWIDNFRFGPKHEEYM